MTEEQAIDKVLGRRAAISHDLLKNGIFQHLGACWRDKEIRGTAKDAIYAGLSDPASNHAIALVDAAKAWNSDLAPEFRSFLEDITETDGFVPADPWIKVKAALLDDILFVGQCLELSDPHSADQALAVSAQFWSRIDKINAFLDKLPGKLWDYFECFDPVRIKV